MSSLKNMTRVQVFVIDIELEYSQEELSIGTFD